MQTHLRINGDIILGYISYLSKNMSLSVEDGLTDAFAKAMALILQPME